MVKFGMANTLVTFQGEYWEYGGLVEVEEKGLTIGGYKSAWFADLVAAYILANVNTMDDAIFNKIYRDDGILIFRGKKTLEWIEQWLEDFQTQVNFLTESEHLQFTVEIWNADGFITSKSKNENITVNCDKVLPYLDTEMF